MQKCSTCTKCTTGAKCTTGVVNVHHLCKRAPSVYKFTTDDAKRHHWCKNTPLVPKCTFCAKVHRWYKGAPLHNCTKNAILAQNVDLWCKNAGAKCTLDAPLVQNAPLYQRIYHSKMHDSKICVKCTFCTFGGMCCGAKSRVWHENAPFAP